MPAKIITYNSQNYAGTLGSGLLRDQQPSKSPTRFINLKIFRFMDLKFTDLYTVRRFLGLWRSFKIYINYSRSKRLILYLNIVVQLFPH